MAIVFEAVPFCAAGRQRQHRIEPVQRLNGRRLIHAKHGCMLRRISCRDQLCPPLSARIADHPRPCNDPAGAVSGVLVPIRAARSTCSVPAPPPSCGRTNASIHPQAFVASCARSSPAPPRWPRGLTAFVTRIESRHSEFFEALLPARDSGGRGLQTPHDLAVAGGIGQRQHQPRPKHITGGPRARLRPHRQLTSLFIRDWQHRLIPSHDYQTDQR